MLTSSENQFTGVRVTSQSAAAILEPALGPAAVAVRAPGSKLMQVMDARTPRFTPEQVAASIEQHEKRAGAVCEHVMARTEQSWAEVRRELNSIVAGGASARVMILAHHSLRAHQALELTTLAAARAFGEEQELADKHMRNQAGLAVVATDLLNRAYEAAREEARALRASNPVDDLSARLAAGEAQREVLPSSPVDPPGGVSSGAPSPSIPPPSGETK
jgi:hypothetical protein